jgi:hypothetical protein
MNNILWLPIDIPKFPLPDLDLSTETSWAHWDFAKLTTSQSSPYSHSEIKDDVDETLKTWFGNFPYSSIRNIKFNIQKDLVSDHIDFTKPELDPQLHENNSMNEPCGYRILVRGTRKGNMYVVHNGVKIYTEMPDDTDVYVLGHTSTLHGVDYEPGRVTIFTHFEIDPILHKQLITRSLQKYGKYAIMAS